MNNSDIQLSKSLSWLLRHGATKERLRISSDGYVEVTDVLKHKTFKGKYTKADIERVVHTNDKQRFKLRVNPVTNLLEIRCNQGHSVREVTDVELSPILEPKYKTVIHGTYMKHWPNIKTEGLSRMNRHHIHLAKGTLEATFVVSGVRRNVEIYIYIDLERALADGLKFYESENGVILTAGNEKGYLEPKYFSRVADVKTVREADRTKAALLLKYLHLIENRNQIITPWLCSCRRPRPLVRLAYCCFHKS